MGGLKDLFRDYHGTGAGGHKFYRYYTPVKKVQTICGIVFVCWIMSFPFIYLPFFGKHVGSSDVSDIAATLLDLWKSYVINYDGYVKMTLSFIELFFSI